MKESESCTSFFHAMMKKKNRFRHKVGSFLVYVGVAIVAVTLTSLIPPARFPLEVLVFPLAIGVGMIIWGVSLMASR
jgi:uncharacterized membrane protein